MLAFWSRSNSYRRAPEALARCEEAFFVVPGLSSVRGRAASTLAPAEADACHASAQDSTTAFRTAEPSTWPGAVISGVRALALAPYLEPRGVYFILVLSPRARRPRTSRKERASHPAPALACA